MITGNIRFSLVFVLLPAFVFVFQAAAQDTQEETNKALVRRIFDEVWNQRSLDVVDETIAANVLMSIPPFPDTVGSDAYKATVAGYLAGFPDAQWAIDDMSAQGDMVATRMTATGTHQGEFAGIPATGVQVTVTIISIDRIADGKIVESRNFGDQLGFMQQLGVIAPARPTPENYMWGAPSEVTGDPGDPEENKAIVVDFIEQLWIQKNLDVLEGETFHPDFVAHSPVEVTSPLIGVEANRQAVIEYLTAFPDMGTVNEVVLAEGDKVVTRWRTTATHLGELAGIPPTGRQVEFTGMTIYRMADGKMVENWWAWDALGLIQQLTAGAQEAANKAFMVSYFDAGSGKEKPAETVDQYVSDSDQALKDHVAMFEAGFPLYEMLIDDMIAEGDKVAVRITFHGTHQGDFAGIPPTGVEATAAVNLIFRIADGMIVEHWMEADQLGLMQQLGVIPADREDYSWGEPLEVTGDPGTPEANKAISLRGYEEVWNQGDLDVIDETHAAAYVLHDPTNPVVTSSDGLKQLIGMYRAAFPDVHFAVEDVIAEGDTVAVRWKSTGTHTGAFMGLPPTGVRGPGVTGISIDRIADGKIVEAWSSWDVLGFMQQMGILPSFEPKNYGNVFYMPLSPGLNMISLPLEPVTPFTARSFVEKLSATMVVRYNEADGRFDGYTPDAPNDGFAIVGGKGYIVNVPTGGMAGFSGAAWTRLPLPAAPPAQRNSAWAFVVSGSVLDGDLMSASDGDYAAVVKSLRTGDMFTEAVDPSGYFAAAWADLNRKAVIGAGDRVEVAVVDSSGGIVSGPFVHEVTLDAIRDAVVNVRLRLGDIIPEKSALLQNYPNPFNPETWIPYHLSDASPVIVKIYSVSGQLIRTLDLGHKDAGVYASQSKAAYWDGRNDAGEEVASAVYFYSITAGAFSATRKMVVKK